MADLNEIENNILSYWKANRIYKKMRERNSSGPKYFFVDGPPYATGQIHPGTAWNKTLKDSVLRYRRACGYNVRDQPGFDTHGLPIEVKVEHELKINDKRQIEQIGVDKFISQCKQFATQYIGVISSQFARCGVWMDWENPYITYEDYYIESIWRTIKAADEKGLLTQGVYVVPQCTRCETTLANYELEYDEQDDPSTYVKFKVKGTENEYLVIWTTTPWTLAANMAVMVHPTFSYVKAKVGDEIWIVAKERLDVVMAFRPLQSAIVLGEMSGKKLEGLQYEHPLQHKVGYEYDRKVVLTDEYVTLEDGSGLVHCAPGHGPEDFVIGRRFSIPIFCPVDASGKYTKDAGQYAGKVAREQNGAIIEDLDATGALIHVGKVRHRYPHCWRCKTPLIFIATPQWFIAITKLKERMLEEIDHSINFRPEFAKTRFRDFVSSAPDWCISRQRYWGAPLPIWNCTKEGCHERKILGSKDEIGHKIKELHRPFIDEVTFPCKCGGVMKRVPDILDVWFDSGNAVWAQLKKGDAFHKEGAVAGEFIVEGKDQTRGWFYSLLGSGVVLNNETPYKNLLMHGFFVDEKGEKMSKSVGNFVPLEDIIGKYGADTFRLWGLSSTVWEDLRFSYKELDENKRVIEIMLNLAVWMNRFYKPSDKPVPETTYELEDRWLRSRTQSVIKAVTDSFETYQPHMGLVKLREFMVEDISRFYLKRLKQRLSEERNVQAGLSTLYETLLTCTQLLSPYTPFVAEHIYLSVFKGHVGEESVSFLPWPQARVVEQDSLLEQQFACAREMINASANARSKAGLKLRWPAHEIKVYSESTEINNAAQRCATLLEAMANVQKISLGKPASTFEKEIHHAKIGAKFKTDTPAVMALLNAEPAEKLAEGLKKQPYMLGGKHPIDDSMVTVIEKSAGFAVAEFDGGKVYIKTVIDKGLYELAMEREIARRIQMMRKEMNLKPVDEIYAYIAGDADLLEIAKKRHETLSKTINAKKIDLDSKAASEGDLVKEWEIEDAKIKISLRRA